ncbi:BON domain-containing protein [Geomonas sp. Red69]|uniref:BON domain-containing protein n=1 Tax=Geomonas diazotrophica TaxID=2843197 RepID=UPI001C0F727C|nr:MULTISPECIES: BON domain-containing protein [Geomonas]MBU5636206.1 BON domain-containing protein [Geomonas diazotrophica]QXE85169.1 BON domain-containing protein [Geomonas nitrogeniifigens]
MLKPRRVLRLIACFALLSACPAYAGAQNQESTGQYVDDSVITAKVKSAIFGDPTLKLLQIKVTTYKGVVQLSGFVDSKQSADKAGEVAREVKGVVSVQNDLIVK